MANPVIKWAGGKRQLVPELLKHVPGQGYHYYEPFCGGAALFFALRDEGRFHTWHLNDANPDLVNVYTQVRDNVEAVIARLKLQDQITAELGLRAAYLGARDCFNDKRVTDPLHRVAHFIALNAHGFNGLCRYNKKGGFNVPCGKFAKTPVLMDKADNLRAASQALKGVEITCGDFDRALEKNELASWSVKAGDVVYFDPPYFPAGTTANFVGYTGDGFTVADQIRLRDLAVTLVGRGVRVILSNSDTEATRKLYAGPEFVMHEVQARRAVNCKADKRGKVGELIIVGRL